MPVISWLPAFVGSHAFVEFCMASGLALFGYGMFLAVREQTRKKALAHRKNLHDEWRRHRASEALALRIQNVLGTGLERLRAEQFQPDGHRLLPTMPERVLNHVGELFDSSSRVHIRAEAELLMFEAEHGDQLNDKSNAPSSRISEIGSAVLLTAGLALITAGAVSATLQAMHALIDSV
jgi:hypothetical protein